jgi:hypothetical protein
MELTISNHSNRSDVETAAKRAFWTDEFLSKFLQASFIATRCFELGNRAGFYALPIFSRTS